MVEQAGFVGTLQPPSRSSVCEEALQETNNNFVGRISL